MFQQDAGMDRQILWYSDWIRFGEYGKENIFLPLSCAGSSFSGDPRTQAALSRTIRSRDLIIIFAGRN